MGRGGGGGGGGGGRGGGGRGGGGGRDVVPVTSGFLSGSVFFFPLFFTFVTRTRPHKTDITGAITSTRGTEELPDDALPLVEVHQ